MGNHLPVIFLKSTYGHYVLLTEMTAESMSYAIQSSTTQELVSVIVEKAVKMAELMNIPVLGLVENMSYYQCPDCGNRHKIYGDSHIEQVAASHGIDSVSSLPIDPKLAASCDKGTIELFDGDWLDKLTDLIEEIGK